MATKKNNLPKLATRGNDLSKTWFVYWYDAAGRRVRKYGNINSFHTIEERTAAADKLIREIQGAQPPAPVLLRIAAYLQSRAREWRRKTLQTYTSKYEMFRLWLAGRDVTRETVRLFLAHVAQTRAPATYNWYVSFFRTVLNRVGAPECVPVVDVKKANSFPAMYFQRHQVKRLKAHMLRHDPELWFFCCFLYYCFIRPGELRLLKVEDVLLDEHKIRVPAAISKNRKTQIVTVPEAFRADLEALRARDAGEYVFHLPGTPRTPYSIDRMNKRHRKVLNALGFSVAYKLYSWKHTGAISAVLAGVTVKELQIQLRHASLEEVDKYLRQLGAWDLGELEKRFPAI